MYFISLCFVFFLTLSFSVSFVIHEPKCSKFDYEEKMLEKLVRMEHSNGLMVKDFQAVTSQVQETLDTMRSELSEEKRKIQENLEEVEQMTLDRLPSVAFHATLTSTKASLPSGSCLVFDRIITNNGGAYNVETGYFTAPIDGTFQFTIVLAALDKKVASVNIMKDKESIGTPTWVKSDPTWTMTSNTVILNLVEGQQVWIAVASDAGSFYYGSSYTSFSGHLL